MEKVRRKGEAHFQGISFHASTAQLNVTINVMNAEYKQLFHCVYRVL